MLEIIIIIIRLFATITELATFAYAAFAAFIAFTALYFSTALKLPTAKTALNERSNRKYSN